MGHGFSGVNNGQRLLELKYVGLLFRDEFGLKGMALKNALTEFCEDHIEGFSYRGYYRMLSSAVRNASEKKNVLIEVSGLPVYKSEIEYINRTGLPMEDRKLMFSILMTKKMDAYCYKARFKGEYKMGFLSADAKKLSRVKKAACVYKMKDLTKEYFHRWIGLGLIRATYTGFVLDFMNRMGHEGEVVMDIKHYDCYGDYYSALMEHSNKIMCNDCGRPISRGGTRKKYCKGCAMKIAHIIQPSVKKITCVSCGKKFYAESRASRTCRCPECVRGMKKANLFLSKSEVE